MLAWCNAWRELAGALDLPRAVAGCSAASAPGAEVVRVLAAMVLALTQEVGYDR